MSEVKRYETDISNIWVDDNGWMVEYDDYAALAKRVEELEFGAHGVTADELRAEITRLREALREREREVVMLSAGITEEEVDDYLAQFQPSEEE